MGIWKEKNPNLKIIGVEPASSPVLTKGQSGPHKIQGIGAGFKPAVLDLTYVDKVVTVPSEKAYEFARLLARKEGLFHGQRLRRKAVQRYKLFVKVLITSCLFFLDLTFAACFLCLSWV